MTYKVQIDGGSMAMHPVIHTKVPLTQFAGELSSETGIYFETLLEKLMFEYGETQPPSKKGIISLKQLATLPESVRMRILLCLDDLGPLEQALELKKESNLFKRNRSVNKGILKMAKKLSKSAKSSSSRRKYQRAESRLSRRRELMAQVMKLDDNELDDLWSLHQKHKKKLAKKAMQAS
jgi:hypothetical protein